jgi:hypothetical protein
MNVGETLTIESEGHVEKHKRRSWWFAILLALLSIFLIIGGIGLFIFAGVTIAGIALLVLTILLLVAGVGLLIAAGVYLVLSTVRVETRSFSVTGHPHIVVHHEIGTMHVKAGSDAKTVTFRTKLHTSRFGKLAPTNWVYYEQSVEGNEIRADVERVVTPGINLPQAIEFDITVPANADLELLTGVGDIWVTGISGQLSLMSDTGSLYVQHGLLTGHSTLKTSLGSINFHERIDPYGTYQFATETGSIHVILPDDTALELDASSNFGTITTVVPGMALAYRTNCEVHGDAGVPPRSSLTLSSMTGSVSVFEESDGYVPGWNEN